MLGETRYRQLYGTEAGATGWCGHGAQSQNGAQGGANKLEVWKVEADRQRVEGVGERAEPHLRLFL